MRDVIYNEECSCLFANDVREVGCLKRYYQVSDVENNRVITIAVCNEYVRLKVREKMFRTDSYSDRGFYARQVIEEVISKNIKINNFYTRESSNDLLNQELNFQVCNRPYIFNRIKIKDAIEMYTNGNHMIMTPLEDHIKSYCNNTIYKKYKTKYEELIRTVKKINRTYGEDNRRMLMLESLLKINQLNIKNYETSKC